jgi:hypothetical protein
MRGCRYGERRNYGLRICGRMSGDIVGGFRCAGAAMGQRGSIPLAARPPRGIKLK